MLGLVIGGAMAAPLAGLILKRLPSRMALILVGIIVASLSVVNTARLFL